MRLTIPLTVKYVAIGCLGIGALGMCRVCRRTRGSDKSKQQVRCDVGLDGRGPSHEAGISTSTRSAGVPRRGRSTSARSRPRT